MLTKSVASCLVAGEVLTNNSFFGDTIKDTAGASAAKVQCIGAAQNFDLL